MASKYTLHYFDMRARGELIRLIFHYKGVAFRDHRIPFEEWDEFKKTHELPFNQLPVLEFDNHFLAQSYAIGRFLANELELTGETNVEKAYLDQIVGGVEDLYVRLLPVIYLEHDEKVKKEKLSRFFTNTYPTWLEYFQRLLVKHENGQKFLLGLKVTWADLALFEIIDLCLSLKSDSLFGYPLLEGYHFRMSSLPTLTSYLEERVANPNTEH